MKWPWSSKNIIKTRANLVFLQLCRDSVFPNLGSKGFTRKSSSSKTKSWAFFHWTLAAFCIKSSFDNPLLLLRTSNLKGFNKDFWSSKSKKMAPAG
jgi:hypothetical protein